MTTTRSASKLMAQAADEPSMLRQRRKTQTNETQTLQDLPPLAPKMTDSDDSEDEETAAVKARLEQSIYTNAKKRVEANSPRNTSPSSTLRVRTPTSRSHQSDEMPSPRVETLSNNIFRAAKDNDVEALLLFREQPRQLFFLFLVAAVVSYYSFTHDSNDVTQNVRTGLSSAVLIFLVYCFLQTRDGLLVRPHPGIWRVVHGCSVVYLLMLTAMSVQNRHGAQRMMQFLFPEVGSLQKASKDALPLECEINTGTIYRGVSSIWFLAHVTGWWGKMCMFRDWRFCWVLSIAFEILELVFQFVIPDFQECWWDSVFMDVLGANLLGMFLGRLTLRYFESKEYDWSGKKERKMGYLLLALSQFTPISWSQYHWEVFSSFKRFAQFLFAMLVCLLVELNAFFLLNTLAIPKESHFNKYRLTLIFLIGIPGAAEYYEFLSNPECWRLGQNAWMILSIAVFEVLVWVKFSANGVLFTDPPPAQVLYPMLAFFLMFAIWMVLFFTQKTTTKTTHKQKRKTEVTKWGLLDVLFWASFTPLLALVTQWAY